MEQSTYKDQEVVNKVFVKGRVATISDVNGTVLFTVVSKNGNRTIFVKMSCKKSVMPQEIRGRGHARVDVEGHIESYLTKKDGKRHITQHFVADKITLSKTLTDEIFGVKGKFFEEPKAQVYLKGTLLSIIEDPEWYRYNIDISNEVRHTTVRVSLKKIDRPVEVKVGDTICALCTISTPEKQFSDGTKQFMDILVSDLAKVNAEEIIYNLEAQIMNAQHDAKTE